MNEWIGWHIGRKNFSIKMTRWEIRHKRIFRIHFLKLPWCQCLQANSPMISDLGQKKQIPSCMIIEEICLKVDETKQPEIINRQVKNWLQYRDD